ncbi:MAG: FAD:protein FMN transferase [Clostridia bacterium]|nr:FAD:protein FMN transferase [Clostridia bacterium]
MRKIAFLLAICLLLSCFSGCAKQTVFSETFYFMDTLIGVTLYTPEEGTATSAFDDCRAILADLEGLWARQKQGSDVARFNEATFELSDADPRTVALLSTALDVSQKTDGAFDVTVAPLVDLWERCGERDKLPTEEELTKALNKTDFHALAVQKSKLFKSDPEVAIDLGGIGKGAAIELLLQHLSTLDLDGGLLTFGSNVAVFGEKPNGDPFRIGLRDPRDAGASVGTMRLSQGQILSVSGDYERYVTIGGENYHHILDPSTGYPANSGLSCVAVIASDGALADALSTALFVMGKDRAIEFYHSDTYAFEAILIERDGTVTVTEGWESNFTKN